MYEFEGRDQATRTVQTAGLIPRENRWQGDEQQSSEFRTVLSSDVRGRWRRGRGHSGHGAVM